MPIFLSFYHYLHLHYYNRAVMYEQGNNYVKKTIKYCINMHVFSNVKLYLRDHWHFIWFFDSLLKCYMKLCKKDCENVLFQRNVFISYTTAHKDFNYWKLFLFFYLKTIEWMLGNFLSLKILIIFFVNAFFSIYH